MNSDTNISQDQPDTEAGVPDALTDKAVELLRQAVRGNGLQTSAVTLKHFNGRILAFEARNSFTITHEISEKYIAGRQQGTILGSEEDLRREIEQETQKTAHDDAIIAQTIEALKTRKDLGFAIDGHTLPLPQTPHNYVVHQQCPACHANGRMPCLKCKGQGHEVCTRCHGQKEMLCRQCRGTRTLNTQQGPIQCKFCQGRGRTVCDLCRRQGRIACKTCHSTGQCPCKDCNGSGWRSLVAALKFKVAGHFSYQNGSLPKDVPPLIDSLGPELVTEGHAKADIVTDKERLKAAAEEGQKNEYAILYDVRLPWGDIDFTIRRTTISGKLFGYRPALVQMGPVLEKILAKGLRLLDDAAANRGDASRKLQDALRYRAISEAVLATAMHPPRKALSLMRERYPFGIQNTTLKNMLQMAGRALQNTTRRPRLYGLGIGLGLTALLYGLYYIGPLRDMIRPHTGAPAAQAAIDFFLVLLGGTITTASIQLTAARALRRSLRAIKSKAARKKLVPKAGQSALWGYLGGLILYFTMINAAIMTGAAAPAWYAKLTATIGL